MITRVRVKNFRSLADVDVTLGPLTVLVGRNGAGKSAFIDALRFVRDALRSNVEEAVRKRDGLERMLNWKPDGGCEDISFEFFLHRDAFAAEYGFTIASEPEGKYFIAREFLNLNSTGQSPEPVFDIEDGAWKVLPSSSAFSFGTFIPSLTVNNFKGRQLLFPLLVPMMVDAMYADYFLKSSNFYSAFSMDVLRRPQKQLHSFPLFEDGTNFASVLQQMSVQGVLPNVTAALKSALDDVEKIYTNSIGSYFTI